MMTTSELIWILDNEAISLNLYQQTLGLQYKLRILTSTVELVETLAANHGNFPSLVIADPETIDGSLSELFNKFKTSSTPPMLPPCLIVSKSDDLDLMRFFLRTGVKDYLLKPICPNELVAKIERTLMQINHREILILRNDLDGNELNDLTFREYQILTVLLSRTDRCASRNDLHTAIWTKTTVNKKTLDVHLFNLRRKLRPRGYDITCIDQIFSLVKMESNGA